MKYLLDTNICIALLKGHERGLAEKLQRHPPDAYVMCSPVKAELYFGARHSQKVEANLSLLEKFFAPFETLSFEDKAAGYYGIIRSLLQKAVTPIGANDLFIASIALAYDLVLITRNRSEFLRVPGLKIESW